MAHLIRFNADSDDDIVPLWIDVPLFQYRGFWKRVWLAVRYVFGYQSKFGAYDTTHISEASAAGIIQVIKTAYPKL